MCLLDETEDDEMIIQKLKNILKLSNENYNIITQDSYNISIKNYTYTQAIERFNKIIDFICNN